MDLVWHAAAIMMMPVQGYAELPALGTRILTWTEPQQASLPSSHCNPRPAPTVADFPVYPPPPPSPRAPEPHARAHTTSFNTKGILPRG